MSTYRVPKCGRHFVKNDDVTIYPVLVVARTDVKRFTWRQKTPVIQRRLDFWLVSNVCRKIMLFHR